MGGCPTSHFLRSKRKAWQGSAYDQWHVYKRSYGQDGTSSVPGAAGRANLTGDIAVNANIYRGDPQADHAVIPAQDCGIREGD